jgi:hypothetical protein
MQVDWVIGFLYKMTWDPIRDENAHVNPLGNRVSI